ncbi:MAG: hypothetical protein JKX76_03040 [Colwellia sp.]|nr:hypothetical protein [Colwellia sp.]
MIKSIDTFTEKLNNLDLTRVSYDKLMGLFKFGKYGFDKIPFTTAIVKKDGYIERGRINYNGEIFYSEKEISYRTDRKEISEYGRANIPGVSRFYGAFPSTEVKYARITLFAELCKEFQVEPVQDMDTTMTIGRWRIKEDFEVAEIVFSKEYLKNPETQVSLNKWMDLINEKNSEFSKEEYKKLLIFFSERFAKKDISHHEEYKLSCAYTDMALYGAGLHGVSYPSSKTKYLSNNIVLPVETVEKFLDLEIIAMFRLKVKNGKGAVVPIAICEKRGDFNTSFKWEDATMESYTDLTTADL